jgi:polar amino acid transport system substrate-binding protein
MIIADFVRTISVSILVLGFFLSSRANAGCSRPVIVPAASLGILMKVNEKSGEVSGIYPDILREMGKKVGCEFHFPIVPRARAEIMVAQGTGDLLVGSVKVPERDAWAGGYVPMYGTEWMLISSRNDHPPKSVEELVSRPKIKLHVVRGYNYGPAYLEMIAQLQKLDKLVYMKDPESIARKMEFGRVDYTYMPSHTFAGALLGLGIKDAFGGKVHYMHLAGLPTSVSGVYYSKKIAGEDVALIKNLLIEMQQKGELLTRLRKLLNEQEMKSTFPLPAANKL